MIRNRSYWIGFSGLLLVVGGIYLGNQVNTIYGGDAGDLASAIVTRGIPHPPGYPFYTIFGIVLYKIITFGTAAWRIGFLSTLPAVLALLFLFDLLVLFTKRVLISFTCILVLAFTYPFWLYSEVVEVFSLNNLFMVLLLWSFFHYLYQKKKKFLYAGGFLLGLSFTHHHIIVFLLPVLLYLILQRRQILTRKIIKSSFLLFLAGLTPYLYVFVSAYAHPAINWMGRPAIGDFVQLVTRATYGTFKAGAFIGNQPFLRVLNIYGFWDFAFKDFRLAGFFLFFAGFIYLLKFQRIIFYSLTIGFISYLFFLFYASFPLAENFIVGTFERFVLPLYILITFYIAYGLLGFVSVLENLLSKVKSRNKSATILNIIMPIFLLYPLGLLVLNYPKISILKNDFTAENLGIDILSSVPSGSIILIGVDTPLFDSQYIYYTQAKWQDIRLIHFNKLINPQTAWQIKEVYSDLIYPTGDISPKDKLEYFLSNNYGKHPIFSKQAYVSENGEWVPWGLLFRYYKKEDIPPDVFIYRENQKIWADFHDPLSLSLSQYRNLLLSDTLRIYSIAHQEIGFWEAKRNFAADAQKHLLAAEKLTPADLDSYSILAQVYIQQKNCEEAKKQIDYRLSHDSEDASNYLLHALNYRLCYKDINASSRYEKLYEEKQKQKETPLKKL